MTLREKYWYTILLTFCRYLSVLMLISGGAFILLGILVNPWFYIGLAIWPLFFMWAIVNFRYVRALVKVNRLEFSKVTEGI